MGKIDLHFKCGGASRESSLRIFVSLIIYCEKKFIKNAIALARPLIPFDVDLNKSIAMIELIFFFAYHNCRGNF